MRDTEQILAAISALEDKIDQRMASIEKRISSLETVQKVDTSRIDDLYRIIKDLTKTDAVVHRYGCRYELDRDSVYQLLDINGYSRRQALRELAKYGIVVKGKEYTKSARVNGGYKRVVVVTVY